MFDCIELGGEGDGSERFAAVECSPAYNLETVVENYVFEEAANREGFLLYAPKLGTAREVHSKEGLDILEWGATISISQEPVKKRVWVGERAVRPPLRAQRADHGR